MRRHTLEIRDRQEIAKVLDAARWGVLGLSQSDCPVLVPLNFVYIDDTIYFHGAPAGEKFELCKENPRGTFLVVEDYSLLPSYAFDRAAACPATQFFKSVILRGHLRLVDSDKEKAQVLQALMTKLQPEGGHEPITQDSDLYRQKLRGVAVIGFSIEDMSAKFKLGQDQTPACRETVQQCLMERGYPVDLQTVSEMQRLAKPNKQDG